MEDKDTIQNYINNFRRDISPHLKANIGIQSNVYPCQKDGAIIEFNLAASGTSTDSIQTTSGTISQALSNIEQRAIGGNLDGLLFSGTNYILESNKILLIKDNDPKEWSEQQAKIDVNKILLPWQVKKENL